jgi:hypothetical protein
VVDHDVCHGLRIIEPINLKDPYAQATRGAGGLIGDEAVSGESVALCSIRVADRAIDSGSTGQFAELTLTEFLARHHHDHSTG